MYPVRILLCCGLLLISPTRAEHSAPEDFENEPTRMRASDVRLVDPAVLDVRVAQAQEIARILGVEFTPEFAEKTFSFLLDRGLATDTPDLSEEDLREYVREVIGLRPDPSVLENALEKKVEVTSAPATTAPVPPALPEQPPVVASVPVAQVPRPTLPFGKSFPVWLMPARALAPFPESTKQSKKDETVAPRPVTILAQTKVWVGSNSASRSVASTDLASPTTSRLQAKEGGLLERFRRYQAFAATRTTASAPPVPRSIERRPGIGQEMAERPELRLQAAAGWTPENKTWIAVVLFWMVLTLAWILYRSVGHSLSHRRRR